MSVGRDDVAVVLATLARVQNFFQNLNRKKIFFFLLDSNVSLNYKKIEWSVVKWFCVVAHNAWI